MVAPEAKDVPLTEIGPSLPPPPPPDDQDTNTGVTSAPRPGGAHLMALNAALAKRTPGAGSIEDRIAERRATRYSSPLIRISESLTSL